MFFAASNRHSVTLKSLTVLFAGLLWSTPVLAADTGTILGGVGAFWLLALIPLFLSRPKFTTVLSALGALGISIYLGVQHGSTEASACNISSTINCDVVNRSEYSELFGIPIAFLGAAFYAAVLILSGLQKSNPKQYTLVPFLTTLGAAAAVLYSLILAVISGAVIKAWCLFCIGLYGANMLLLASSILTARQNSAFSLFSGIGQSLLGKDDSSIGTALGSFVVVLVGLTTLVGGATPEGPARSASGEAILDGLLSSTQAPLVLDGTEPVLGSRSAPFTVVEFADYECPHCGRVAPDIKAYVESNKDVKLLFKHYPISNACNPNVTHEGHANACDAALASECALAQSNGLLWKLNRLTFKNQTSLDSSNIQFLAKQVGLDMALYESCMQQPETLVAIQADISAANVAGLTGTPSFYISGHRDDGVFERIEGGVDELAAVFDAVRQSKPIPSATAYAP